jgi:hypothetical protein
VVTSRDSVSIQAYTAERKKELEIAWPLKAAVPSDISNRSRVAPFVQGHTSLPPEPNLFHASITEKYKESTGA